MRTVDAPGLGGLAWEKLGGPVLKLEVEDLAPRLVNARLGERRNVELVLEVQLADVGPRGARPDPDANADDGGEQGAGCGERDPHQRTHVKPARPLVSPPHPARKEPGASCGAEARQRE